MLANPIFLLALTGLSIPIAIHLLSRKEGKIIKLGSIRHVTETSTQQFKGIKLNEILLLLLRCSLIVVLSLLLSGLQCTNTTASRWALVERGLEKIQSLAVTLDSLAGAGYELHCLADGFPLLKDGLNASSVVNYRQLITQLRQKNLEEAVVIAKNRVDGFKGLRVALPANVRWISQPQPSLHFPFRAVSSSRDSALLRAGYTASDRTDFETKRIASHDSPVAITAPDTINIVLVTDADFEYDKKIIKAALIAIEKSVPIKIILSEKSRVEVADYRFNWCVWLSSEKPLAANVGNIISVHPRSANELFIQTAHNRWTITKRLNEEVALGGNLALHLASLMLSKNENSAHIQIDDRRMVDDVLAWDTPSAEKTALAFAGAPPADRYLIILLILLLVIERIIAYNKNQ